MTLLEDATNELAKRLWELRSHGYNVEVGAWSHLEVTTQAQYRRIARETLEKVRPACNPSMVPRSKVLATITPATPWGHPTEAA